MKRIKILRKTILSLLLIPLAFAGCITTENTVSKENTAISPTLGGKLFTSAWEQRSAEYKALCIQAYNIAMQRIMDQITCERIDNTNPLAIITDIDETILDNSPITVQQSLKGSDFDYSSWDKWCDMAAADTLCGALDFFKKAKDLGFTIFYITNRSEKNRQGTLKNLQKYGFPFADDTHLLTMKNTSNKEPRRKNITKKYNVIMLLGDNLGDFSNLFDSSDEKQRNETLSKFAKDFGKKFIVLPNPNYGTWEKAMTGGSYSLRTRDSTLIHCLKQPQ